MSDVKNRSYQLMLAFEDNDLKTPEHDRIVLWLAKWAKQIDNIKPFLSDRHDRVERTKIELDSESQKILADCNERYSIELHLKSENEKFPIHVPRKPWPDEPPMKYKYSHGEWEPQLHTSDNYGSYKRMIGYLDYAAHYVVSSRLHRTNVITKKLVFEERAEATNQRKPRNWSLVEVGSRVDYWEEECIRTIYFEVKSEIKSIGALMRQLTLYRHSDEVKSAFSRNGLGVIVVAPNHPIAAGVLEEQGYAFLAYDRKGLTT